MHSLLVVFALTGAVKDDPAGVAFFEKKIRPVLVKHCFKCHSKKKPKGGLRLDTRQAIRRGGESGPAVVPGKLNKSILIQAIRHETFKMPPNGKLSKRQIADFEHWIQIGAPDPRGSQSKKQAQESWEKILAKRRQIWSLQPVKRPALPRLQNAMWAKPIDRFIYKRLMRAKLRPAAIANRETLLRRLSFALRGVPPTAGEIQHFKTDPSPEAYDRLVDRLLASPRFGERWARHWMDVVRFTETHGHEWNFEVRGAWRYRDYLIRAFNRDLPYDQLVREHIAGDLLRQPRWNANSKINESLIGTAFYRFGEVGHDNCLEFREISLDVIDNQIDTLTKAFQAMTVSCARCHDHKLDAVSNRDYYALSGIIGSSRYISRTIDDPGVNREIEEKLQQLKGRIRRTLGQQWLAEVRQFTAYAKAIRNPAEKIGKALKADQLKLWRALFTKAQKARPGLDDPLRPWHDVVARQATGVKSLAETWRQLSRRYQRESLARDTFNRSNYQPLGKILDSNGTKGQAPWHREGLSLRSPNAGGAQSRDGEFTVKPSGDKIIGPILPAGLYTHRLSNRLNGGLRSPFLPKDKKFVSLKVVGGGKGVVRTIYDNCHLGVKNSDLASESPKWITLPTYREYGESNIYIALVTKFDNQFYPKYDTQHRVDYSKFRSYFGVTDAVLHDSAGPPKESLQFMLQFVERSKVNSLDSLIERYQQTFERVIQTWMEDTSAAADMPWLVWLHSNGLISNSIKTATPQLKQLVDRYRATELRIQPPKIINSIGDLNPGFDVPLRVRGDPFKLGDRIPRRYVHVLAGQKNSVFRRTAGSGRLELANLIANRSNPLTARVMVNRVWHHLFGTGIVATPDDFGAIGERPSHPRLLDYLADQFVADGWSVKQLIRTIVRTRTYRMSSRPRKGGQAVDPQNRLLHHFPLRRLEAEAIRDALLVASGRLDRRMYGPSIHPYRYKERKNRRLFSGPLDGRGRRSVYMKLTLTEEPPFLTVFNLPEAKVTRGRREVTSVPAQALALLNDPFVHAEAEVWADRIVGDGIASLDQRLKKMIAVALGRTAAPRETARFVMATRRLATLRGVPSDKIMTDKRVWKDVAHLVFNLKEFIYVR